MGVQCAVVSKEIVTPHVVDQLFSGQSNASVAHQIKQQLIFLWRKVDLLLIDIYQSTGKVDF